MAIPVSLADARRQLKMEPDDSSRDADLSDFIADAAGWVERYTGHILVKREVTERFRGFSPPELRAWPISADAAVGVAYSVDGTPVAVPGARLDLSSRPARVRPAAGCFFTFLDSRQLFTVTLEAGYPDAASVPRNLRRAMLVLIAAFDADREGGDVFNAAEATARTLCSDFRLRRI